MRKPAFCICENKDADQLRVNREADQRLCLRYIDSITPLLSKSIFKLLAIFCGCTARFVSDLVGNPEDRFSHNEAHLSNDQEPVEPEKNLAPKPKWEITKTTDKE